MALGKEVYHRNASCVTCHQAQGQGQPGLYPPLRDNPRVLADDPERLIKVVTQGLHGPLEVKGKTYDSIMAGTGRQLSPEETAAVITFIRNTWRHGASPVSVEQVVAVQAEHAERTTPWTVAELEAGGRDHVGIENPEPVELIAVSSAAPGGHAAGVPEDPKRWGEELYNGASQCASCHGPDGQGAPGVYPPLAGSPWVTGDLERLIKVSLQGVGGEMNILGTTYNSEMPGQGALVDDAQMAATLTYIRQAWGNDASLVYPDQVQKLREKFADRHEPWPAEMLAAVDERSPLQNVRYRRLDLGDLYQSIELGTPEFDALPVLKEGAFEDGFIDIQKIEGHNDDQTPFAVIIEAEFEVPAEDQYRYAIESYGSAVLLIDGEPVTGRSEIKYGRVNHKQELLLSPGRHTLRLDFGNPKGKWRWVNLSARAESVNRALWRLSRNRTTDLVLSDPTFLLIPERDEPIVMRGRFEGLGSKGLAVGHPLRVNYTYDFRRSQLVRMWRGDFINSAGVWAGRNDKYMPPEGDDILELGTRPPLAILASPADAWASSPEKQAVPAGYDSRGYTLENQLPVFYTRVGGSVLRDTLVPQAGAPGGPATMKRRFDVFAAEPDPHLHALLADGEQIVDVGDGVYTVDGLYRVVVEVSDGGATPSILEQDGRQLLVAQAIWEPGPIDLPAWVLRTTPLTAGTSGQVANWQWEYQWIEQ